MFIENQKLCGAKYDKSILPSWINLSVGLCQTEKLSRQTLSPKSVKYQTYAISCSILVDLDFGLKFLCVAQCQGTSERGHGRPRRHLATTTKNKFAHANLHSRKLALTSAG